jgi:transketolase
MTLSDEEIKELEDKAKKLRRTIIKMLAEAGSGHSGGSLSAIDIITALYFKKMKHNPKEPKWPERDRFVLCKGHACPALYATLAECGYFPVDELWKLRKTEGMLQGHPDSKSTPGIEVSTGSLGQGLAIANGIAAAGKIDSASWRVYALIGDGESQEGEVWEAAMFGAHNKLDNLTAFLDRNRLQIDGPTNEVMCLEPVADKWKAFGWNVLEINGHDFKEIFDALEKAEQVKGKPTMIIAHTVKGKGVSFMENQVCWHGNAPSADEAERALQEIEKCRCDE